MRGSRARRPEPASHPGPQARPWHGRATPSGRVPEQQVHLRPGHRRCRGPHVGRRLLTGVGSSHSDNLNLAAAAKVGEAIADRAKDAGVKTVVFDRGGYKFHGKVKALADAAREAGLEF